MPKLNRTGRISKIRLLQCVSHISEREKSLTTLHKLIQSSRITATPHVVIADRFHHVLHQESQTAALVFLGFLPPAKFEEVSFLKRTGELIAGLPTTVLVHSSGNVALDA